MKRQVVFKLVYGGINAQSLVGFNHGQRVNICGLKVLKGKLSSMRLRKIRPGSQEANTIKSFQLKYLGHEVNGLRRLDIHLQQNTCTLKTGKPSQPPTRTVSKAFLWVNRNTISRMIKSIRGCIILTMKYTGLQRYLPLSTIQIVALHVAAYF